MAYAVEFRNISKAFGPTLANNQVSFSIRDQSIHGVVGENGAGKSTIMKILYGLYQPDEGEIFFRGTRTQFHSPQDAIRKGIGMVHQHFMLVPTLSVWQNIILGSEPSLFLLDETVILPELDELQRQFGFSLDLNALIENLSVGLQQQVEILKVLYRRADILILDEPTAVLTPLEVITLFERLKILWQNGKTIILISHKLKEILSFTQTVTVMRQGKVIETLATGDLTPEALAEKMIGRKQSPLPKPTANQNPKIVLDVHDLSLIEEGRHRLDRLSLKVHAGEIVGIAGVEGNGQSELVEVLANVKRSYEGRVSFEGLPLKNQPTYQMKQRGLSIIPPDRHQEGVILNFSVMENVILGHHKEERFTKNCFLSFSKTREYVEKLLRRFDVRPPNPDLPLESLSGGNQQKVVTARETAEGAKLLVAAHPTRGVDIGAIEFIHKHFLELRESGAAILVISSELDEILALSDRVLVLFQGKIRGETKRADANETQLGLWMTGGG